MAAEMVHYRRARRKLKKVVDFIEDAQRVRKPVPGDFAELKASLVAAAEQWNLAGAATHTRTDYTWKDAFITLSLCRHTPVSLATHTPP